METDPATAQPTWPREVRTIVSLLLVAHLFAVFVAVTSYTRPSALQDRLHGLFGPYLRNLHLTVHPVTYPFARYYLTQANPGDVDFSCEVEMPGKDGAVEKVVIPERGLQPLVRYRRYQALANAVGFLVQPEGNEDNGSVLPKAIASSILKKQGATEGTFLCRAHYLPELIQMVDVDAGRRGPLENYGTIYEAQVLVSLSGVELLKKSTTLEVAPVEGASPGASGARSQNTPKP
jgi:hypothetical protein